MRSLVQHLIDAAPDAIIIVDASGTITSTNVQAERLFEYVKDELVGEELGKLMPPRYRGTHAEHVARYFRAPSARPMGAPLELYARRSDGTEFPVEISLSPLDTSGGMVAVAAIRDISDRVEAAEALRRSEEKYRSLIELAPDAVLLADPASGRLLDCNDAACELFGRPREELIGSPQHMLHPTRMRNEAADAFRQFVQEVKQDGGAHREAFPIRLPGGKTGYADITGKMTAIDDEAFVFAFFRDVTERKEKDEQLRRSEARLREAQQIANLGHWVWDMQTGELAWSDEVYRIFGCEPGSFEPTYERFLEMVHPDDRTHVEREVQDPNYHVEHRIIRPGGEVRVVEERGRVTQWEGECPAEMTGTVLDVTERRRVEDRMREAQRIAEFGYWTIVPETNEATWSDELYRMLGYEPEAFEPTLEDCFAAVHPDDQVKAKRFVKALLDGGGSRRTELRLLRNDGAVRVVETRGAFSHSDDRDRAHITGIHFDITERQSLRNELDREREFLQKLFDSIPVMITVYDPDMDEFRVNKEFERVLGWSAEDARATDLMAACYPDPEYRQEVAAFMQAPGTGWKNFKLKNRAGDDVFCAWTNIRLSDNTQVGIGIDRTDRRQLEAQLRQSQKMETIGTLAGGVAHDFNNILHAVLVYVQLTTAELPAEHSTQTYLDRAAGGIERAKKLTEQLLAFSRKGRPEESETFDVEAIVRETVDLLQPTLSPEVELALRIDDGCAIEGDPDQIQQVVMNLLTNAHQAMDDGSGGVIEVDLRPVDVDADIAARHLHLEAGSYMRLMISDTGSGIDPDVKEHIFEPFFTTKTNGEGSGLGLAVVHGIVRSHEGEITLYSEPGKGTTFHVYLPAAKKGADATVAPAIEAEGEHILFVDDDPDIVEIESVRLRRLGYRVTTRTGGRDALDLIEERHQDFDLVITDYAMPECNGLELARRVQTKNPNLPVVLVSGFSAQLSRQDIEGAGVHAYVKKPIFTGELERVLATL